MPGHDHSGDGELEAGGGDEVVDAAAGVVVAEIAGAQVPVAVDRAQLVDVHVSVDVLGKVVFWSCLIRSDAGVNVVCLPVGRIANAYH